MYFYYFCITIYRITSTPTTMEYIMIVLCLVIAIACLYFYPNTDSDTQARMKTTPTHKKATTKTTLTKPKTHHHPTTLDLKPTSFARLCLPTSTVKCRRMRKTGPHRLRIPRRDVLHCGFERLPARHSLRLCMGQRRAGRHRRGVATAQGYQHHQLQVRRTMHCLLY